MSGIRLRICVAVLSAAWAVGCMETTGTLNSPDAGGDASVNGGAADGNGDNANTGEVDGGPTTCPTGYVRRGNECVDIDECAQSGACDVHATCTNTAGSFTCQCADGYTGDGSTCTDIDECAVNNGGCGNAAYATCTNNLGAAATCTDLDNCASNNGGCGALLNCVDQNRAAPTCVDIDECAVNNGGCAATDACINNGGAPPSCDPNECLVNNGGCTSFYDCVNNLGAAPTCVDANECFVNNGGCTSFYTCVNNVGAVATCTDFDECTVNNGGCGEVGRATCANNVGAAPTCGDINECLVNNGDCGAPAYYTCTNNTRIPPTCNDLGACNVNNGGCGDAAFNSCTYGAGGAVVCTDINECATGNGGCGDDTSALTCVNPLNAKSSCTDVDECANPALNDCPVNRPCVNVKGGYYCGCDYPKIFDSATGCRPARVLVLEDAGGTSLLADLQAAGFAATTGGLYYQWNQSPNLSDFDTILWLEGTNYGNPLLPGVDQLFVDFVKSGGGLVRTEWGLWSAANKRKVGQSVNPLTIPLMPVGLLESDAYGNAAGTWTVTNPTSPLAAGLPASITTGGGYTLLQLLPGSEAIATTLDSRVVNTQTVQTVVPVVSYTAIHGGVTVHVNDTLYSTRTPLEPDIKKVYLNAVHFSAQRISN